MIEGVEELGGKGEVMKYSKSDKSAKTAVNLRLSAVRSRGGPLNISWQSLSSLSTPQSHVDYLNLREREYQLDDATCSEM